MTSFFLLAIAWVVFSVTCDVIDIGLETRKYNTRSHRW
jgi:hypothetical protein